MIPLVYNIRNQITILQKVKYLVQSSRGDIKRIVGDETLVIGTKQIKLYLVDTPAGNEHGYSDAKAFTTDKCRLKQTGLYVVDEGLLDVSDDIMAVVLCDSFSTDKPLVSLNELLIENDHAKVLTEFCSVSDFADESWAKGEEGC